MTQFRAATGWLIIGGVVAWAMVVLVPLGFSLPASVRIFGYGAPALALVFGGVTLESNGVVLPSLLARVGQYSYSIYLSHILVLSAIVQFWPGHQIHGWPSAVGIGLLMCGGAVGVGAISYHWFEQPMLTWSRRWLAQHGRTLATPPPAPALVNAGRGEANVTL